MHRMELSRRSTAAVSPALGNISAHAAHPPSATLVCATHHGALLVYQLRQLRSHPDAPKPLLLHGHSGAVRKLLFSDEPHHAEPCGRLLLLFSASADRTVRIWDLNHTDVTNACVQTLVGHGGTVTDIVYGNSSLITSSTDGTIRVWEAKRDGGLMLYPWFSPAAVLDDVRGWANALALHARAEPSALYVGDSTGTISVYRAIPQPNAGFALEMWRRQPSAHELGISQLLILSPDSVVASLAFDCTARFFDMHTGTPLLSIENERGCHFTSACWDREHAELLLGDEQGSLLVWDTTLDQPILSEKLQKKTPHAASQVSKRVGGLARKPVVVAEAAARTSVREGGSATAIVGLSVLNGQLYTSGGSNIATWALLRGVYANETRAHTGPVIGLAAALPRQPTSGHEADALRISGLGDKNHGLLYSASIDGTIRVWEADEMSTTNVLQEQRSEIACLHLAEACDQLFTGHDDGSIRRWNVESGSTVTLSAHSNTITALASTRHRSSDILFATGYDGSISVWDVTQGTCDTLPKLEVVHERAHSDEVLTLAVASLGKYLLSAGNEGTIKVWSSVSFSHQRGLPAVGELVGHEDAVLSLAVDGNLLFSGSDDGTVRVWDLHSRGKLGLLRPDAGAVIGLLLLPGNGWLIVCGSDCTVRVWDTTDRRQLHCWSHGSDRIRCMAVRRESASIVVGTDGNSLVTYALSEVPI